MSRALRESLRAPARGTGGGWFSIIPDPYPGAWQQNAELLRGDGIKNPTVYTCVSLIACDIAKLALRLVAERDDVWITTSNPAYSPVLRRPNRYQLTPAFIRQWITSKLIAGNTYVLKQRDARGVVAAAYVLNPRKVTVLIAPDGGIYYELTLDELVGVPAPIEGTGRAGVVVPASEIMHDVGMPLEHPLVGVSPLYAAGAAALQGSTIAGNSTKFFTNGAYPGGVILIPTDISDENAAKIEQTWKTNFSGENAGNVAILSRGAKFEPLAMTAVDAQVIEQLKWSAETVASVYHVPYYLAGGPPPPYANAAPLIQQYYSQCLQSLINDCETVYADGLELGGGYALEFDADDLIWLDFDARGKAAHDTINAGALSPNEARKKFFGMGPVPGGESPYLQQQYYPLPVLAARELVPASTVPTIGAEAGTLLTSAAPVAELEAGILEALEAAAVVEGVIHAG